MYIKPQLNEDSIAPVKDIHAKLIHLQTLLAIEHEETDAYYVPIPLIKRKTSLMHPLLIKLKPRRSKFVASIENNNLMR